MNKERKKELINLLVIVLACIVFSYVLKAFWLLLLAIAVLIGSMVSPNILKWVNFIWLKISKVLGFFSSRILLSTVFFLVLCPLALLSKLFKSSDNLKLSQTFTSTFNVVDKTCSKADFEKPW